jgi:hypothetical protein
MHFQHYAVPNPHLLHVCPYLQVRPVKETHPATLLPGALRKTTELSHACPTHTFVDFKHVA